MTGARTVLVPRERMVRWFENFATRHEAATLRRRGRVRCTSRHRTARPRSPGCPSATEYDGPADAGRLRGRGDDAVPVGRAAGPQGRLRRRDRRPRPGREASKVGQRHVQGRTKAGGQSQQRFARRRDNQARQAYEAAAEHAHRILTGRLTALVCGGDRTAVEQVLADPRLRPLADAAGGPVAGRPRPAARGARPGGAGRRVGGRDGDRTGLSGLPSADELRRGRGRLRTVHGPVLRAAGGAVPGAGRCPRRGPGPGRGAAGRVR